MKELENHVATMKHVTDAKRLIGQRTLLSMPSTSQVTKESPHVSEGAIRLAVFLAEHNLPFTVMEHMPKLLEAVRPDSNIARKIACSRTKSPATVKNVTGWETKERLCDLLRKNKFSLIVDEATDSSCCKHLCLPTRVSDGERVVDAFFDLIQIHDATAQAMCDHSQGFWRQERARTKRM